MTNLPAHVRSQVNKLAHSMAEQYELTQRRAITARLCALLDNGGNHDDVQGALKELRREVWLGKMKRRGDANGRQ